MIYIASEPRIENLSQCIIYAVMEHVSTCIEVFESLESAQAFAIDHNTRHPNKMEWWIMPMLFNKGD